MVIFCCGAILLPHGVHFVDLYESFFIRPVKVIDIPLLVTVNSIFLLSWMHMLVQVYYVHTQRSYVPAPELSVLPIQFALLDSGNQSLRVR